MKTKVKKIKGENDSTWYHLTIINITNRDNVSVFLRPFEFEEFKRDLKNI